MSDKPFRFPDDAAAIGSDESLDIVEMRLSSDTTVRR